jgi:hypothetical protein
MSLTTDEAALVAAFETCTLPPGQFHHREHLLVAWAYLREAPFLDAAVRFVGALRRYAGSLGASAKYHETLTLAFLALVHERLDGAPGSFSSFLEQHPELLDGKALLRASGYDEARLDSDAARRGLVLPVPQAG